MSSEPTYQQLEARVNELEERISTIEQQATDSNETDDPLVTSHDRVVSGIDRSDKRPYARAIVDEVAQDQDHEDGAPIETVLDALTDQGYEESEAKDELTRLRGMGEIYEPKDGHLKVV